MGRSFSGTQVIYNVAPHVIGGIGTIYVRFTPTWSSGDSTAHYLWVLSVGTTAVDACTSAANNVVAGFMEAGNDARIIASSAGIFAAGVEGKHVYDMQMMGSLVRHHLPLRFQHLYCGHRSRF